MPVIHFDRIAYQDIQKNTQVIYISPYFALMFQSKNFQSKKNIIAGRNPVVEALKQSAGIDKILLFKNASGDVINDARADNDQKGSPEVVMIMNSDGAQKWRAVTAEASSGTNKKAVAIVLDDNVLATYARGSLFPVIYWVIFLNKHLHLILPLQH